ncbi:uncharacterized protein LOC117649573 [Thrips palmi]|uniref:Uncharacterized protein LOC117649573 n=1 Tax=Thrips palmi TaxID=161013 RepID=A0A6P8ZSZ7_THRPL|nr:uncharacterized protein LOC117649573 [Thrips palmi]
MTPTVLVAVALLLRAAPSLAASYDDLAQIVAPTVTCMGARCVARVIMPIRDQGRNKDVLNDIEIKTEFEEYDMALHFTGTLNREKIFDVEISGENPTAACHSMGDQGEDQPPLMLCMSFGDINSVGNSLQACATVGGGKINNPPTVVSQLGCFLADTQTSSMEHAIQPRRRAMPS